MYLNRESVKPSSIVVDPLQLFKLTLIFNVFNPYDGMDTNWYPYSIVASITFDSGDITVIF